MAARSVQACSCWRQGTRSIRPIASSRGIRRTIHRSAASALLSPSSSATRCGSVAARSCSAESPSGAARPSGQGASSRGRSGVQCGRRQSGARAAHAGAQADVLSPGPQRSLSLPEVGPKGVECRQGEPSTRHVQSCNRPRIRGNPSSPQCAECAAQSRHPVRPGAGRRRARQSLGSGAARRDAAQAADGEEGMAGGVAGQGDPVHRPHVAELGRHRRARAPALRQGGASAAARYPGGAGPLRPADHHRRGVRLPSLRRDRGRGAQGFRRSGRRRVDRVSRRPGADGRTAARDRGVGRRGGGGDRRRHHARIRAHRPVAGALRRGEGVQGGVRTGAHEDDPRHRRPQDAAQCRPALPGWR